MELCLSCTYPRYVPVMVCGVAGAYLLVIFKSEIELFPTVFGVMDKTRSLYLSLWSQGLISEMVDELIIEILPKFILILFQF